MNRRRFVKTLLGTAAAASVLPVLDLLPAPVVPALAFRSDAFALNWFSDVRVSRLDVLYGFARFTPAYGCRIMDTPEPAPGGFLRYVAASQEAESARDL